MKQLVKALTAMAGLVAASGSVMAADAPAVTAAGGKIVAHESFDKAATEFRDVAAKIHAELSAWSKVYTLIRA